MGPDISPSSPPSPAIGEGAPLKLEAEGLMACAGAAAASATAFSTRWAEALAYFRAKQREFFLQQLRPAVGALHLGGAGQHQFFKVAAAHEAMIFVDWHRYVPLMLIDELERVAIPRSHPHHPCHEHSTLQGRRQRGAHNPKGTGTDPTGSV
jgi:hypothetical protein